MCAHKQNDNFDHCTQRFLTWFEQQPGTKISAKVQVTDLRAQNQGRGLVARDSIDEDEELFSIPTNLVLSVANSTLDSKVKKDLEPLEDWAALVIVLIYEDGKGDESWWSPYLSILPWELDTLIFWSEEELSELQGSTVLQKIGKKDAEGFFRETLWQIVKANVSHFGRHRETLQAPHGIDCFVTMAHRMASLIFAYGFDLTPADIVDSDTETEDESNATSPASTKSMIPLADLLNADADLNNARLVQSESCLTMTTIKQIARGDQIFNDFGELPRSGLLRLYGYTTDRYKQWDVVEIPEPLIVSAIDFTEGGESLADDDLRDRLILARKWDVWEEGYDLTWGSNEDPGLPPSLIGLIGALQLPSRRLASKEYGGCPWQTDFSRAPAIVHMTLKNILDLRLQQYGSTISEDTINLQQHGLPYRRRLAIEVRRGEKELIAHWLQKTHSNIERTSLMESKISHEDTQQAKRQKIK